ncbi:MAG: hypothetical protein ABI663_03100 [Chryseolinea sp.]
MQTWLEDYEYRIILTWDIFAIAGISAVVIALLTVSYPFVPRWQILPIDSDPNRK